METVGIVGAMQEEVELLQKTLENVVLKNKAGMDFYSGTFKGKKVVAVMSGIGKVNASIATQILIDVFNADCIINTGVAGAVSRELNIGDVVISTEAAYHDFTTPGDECGYIPRMNMRFFKADETLINAAKSASEACCNKKAVLGRVVTGDCFVSKAEQKSNLEAVFSPMCVEMEGCAVAHTAYLNNVPFVIIRAMSDNADMEAVHNYAAFEKECAKIAADIVINMIEHID